MFSINAPAKADGPNRKDANVLLRRDNREQPLVGLTAGFCVLPKTFPARRLGTDEP
jgi:hypothetical protein